MKPAPFLYFAPQTREEALALLAEHGYDAKALAGGQSLVPAMNFRLAQPAVLVDLNGITDLVGIEGQGERFSGILIRAMTRQRAVERHPLIAAQAPLISETLPHVAHPQIRNRGTFGGNLAHADPASELPAVMVALDAQMRAQKQGSDRWIAASDFFLGIFTTALEPDELLVEISIPAMPDRTGVAFEEMSRRHGDYALAGCAARVTLAPTGVVADARLVFFSVGDGPTIARSAQTLLQGAHPTVDGLRAAAEAVDKDIDPPSDIHASAAFRRHLAKVLARRALERSVARVKQAER